MAETSGCCPASAKADYMIKVIVLRVHRGTASSGIAPVRSTGQCNTVCSLSAGVWKPKVFRHV